MSVFLANISQFICTCAILGFLVRRKEKPMMLIVYSMEIPPKGCLLLVEAILAGASEKGAETRLVNLRELNIQERR
jgi:hypothetical protein